MSRRFTVKLGDVYSYGGAGNPETVPGKATISDTYTLADWLEPIFMSDNSQGEMGEARLLAHKHPETLNTAVSNGQAVRIYDAGADFSDVENPTCVFAGVIVKLHFVIQGNAEQAEIVAYMNADYLLHRLCIHGQYRRTYEQESSVFTSGADGSNDISGLDQLVRIDTPTCFNPDGLYNMSGDTWAVADVNVEGDVGESEGCDFVQGTHIFEVSGRHQFTAGSDGPEDAILIESKPWTLGKAIQYLMTTNATTWAIDPASWSAGELQAMFCTNGDPVISNINLEGKSLGQALVELLEPYNYGFNLSPMPNNDGLHTIEFFYKGTGEEADVYLEDRDTNATGSESNLISADFTRDASPVVNSVTSYGNQIVFTTLACTHPPSVGTGQPPLVKLEKGWRDDDLVWATDSDGKVNIWDIKFRQNYVNAVNLISKLGSDEEGYHYPYGVGRYWVVNLGEQPNASLMDLTPALNDNADGSNSIDPRRLEKPEIYDRNAEGGFLHQEEVQVEMSFDNGSHWAVVDRSFYQLGTENMSLTFTEPHLEKLGLKFINADFPAGVNYWEALKTDKLQIRVLCGVKSDERLAEQTTNDGAAFPLAVERIYINQGYRKNKYNPRASDAVYYEQYEPVEATVDDRSALAAVNQQHLVNTNREMVQGEFRCVLKEFRDFYPGQIVSSIGSRFTFSPAPTILRVIYDFPSQHVRLILDNKYCKTVISTKHLSGVDRDHHHVGVENPSPMQGNKVPFIPGSKSSWVRSLFNGAGDEGADGE